MSTIYNMKYFLHQCNHHCNGDYNCDAFRDLVPFVQFKKREKNTHGGVLLFLLKVTFFHGCFSRF